MTVLLLNILLGHDAENQYLSVKPNLLFGLPFPLRCDGIQDCRRTNQRTLSIVTKHFRMIVDYHIQSLKNYLLG